MDLFQAIILGAVQGLTEFLPVSSSAHLIIVPYLFGWESFDNKLTFDIALHLGTAVAVLVYFRKDWLDLILSLKNPASDKAKLLYFIILGSVPAGLLGLLFQDLVESLLRSPYVIVVNLVIFSILLWLADRKQGKKLLKEASLIDSLITGTAQAIALMPGVSRSGITISAALFRGLKREDAARFSFLLSTPIILATSALKALDFLDGQVPQSEYGLFLAGFLSAVLVGFLAIKFLLKFIQKNSFNVFVFYRLGLALVLLLVLLSRRY